MHEMETAALALFTRLGKETKYMSSMVLTRIHHMQYDGIAI